MQLEEFSGGYYSLDMDLQPYSDGPVIEAGLYNYIRDNVYAQTDAPITFKLSMDNGAYFKVSAETAIPPSVLALPEAWIENFTGDGGDNRVFVLKPEHSYLLQTAEHVGE